MFTTQKGALLAIGVVSAILCAPAWSRYRLLYAHGLPGIRRCRCRFATDHRGPADPGSRRRVQPFIVCDADHVHLARSLAMDLAQPGIPVWRRPWRHRVAHSASYAPNFFNPSSDNLFVFLYANFGLFGLVYLAWTS